MFIIQNNEYEKSFRECALDVHQILSVNHHRLQIRNHQWRSSWISSLWIVCLHVIHWSGTRVATTTQSVSLLSKSTWCETLRNTQRKVRRYIYDIRFDPQMHKHHQHIVFFCRLLLDRRDGLCHQTAAHPILCCHWVNWLWTEMDDHHLSEPIHIGGDTSVLTPAWIVAASCDIQHLLPKSMHYE